MKKQNNDNIRAHLIRSVLCVLLLLAVGIMPFALAQSRSHANTKVSAATAAINRHSVSNPATAPPSSGAVDTQFAIPSYPKQPRVILYDQYDNASATGTLSTAFADLPLFSSDLADDFVVPTGETWNIQSIDADGMILGPGPVSSFNVFFYADNAGLPGVQVFSAMNQPFSVSGSTFTVNLPSLAVLASGTYWVEIQANMMFIPNGAWIWTDRTVQSNQGAVWQNPGGGVAECATWALKTTCVPITGGPDQVFRLNGTTGEGSPTPTASPSTTATATGTPTASGTPSSTATPSGTISPTATPSATGSPSGTPSATPSATGTPSGSPSATPSATGSPSATATPTASGTPSATATPSGTPGVCVRGQGYWKNHPAAWPVTELQLGNVTYTQQQLLDILHEPVRGNGLLILAHQLIAAKLNIAAGADPSCIQQTIAEADALIGDLVIPPVGNGYLAPRDAAPLAGILGRFNEGGMCAPSCDHGPRPSVTPTPGSRPRPAPRP
ncbi:MAG: hypothetical protein ACJ8LL_02335 [Candidatus Udaeobacter sp.]